MASYITRQAAYPKIYHDSKTGEFLERIGVDQCGDFEFRVLISPAPMLGKREDMVIQDDVTFPPSYLKMTTAANTVTSPITKERLDELYNKLVYGDERDSPTGVLRFTSGSKTPAYKEKEMEIGGDRCHLCGADKMYLCTDMRVSPKHVHRSCHTVYQCGTEIMKSWRDDEYGAKDRQTQNIHVGSECIDVD
jgi:hypothetical protein